MKTPLITFSKLYGPILLSASTLTLAFFVDDTVGNASVTLTPFGIISVNLPIGNVWIFRFLIFTSSIVPFLAYLSYDFSKFFPENFDVEIFFDSNGIEDRLSILNQNEIDKLRMPHNYQDGRKRYYSMMDSDMSKTFQDNPKYDQGDGFYSLNTGYIRCKGKTTFKLRKIKGGFQNYRIEKSYGVIEQILEREGKPDFNFESRFELYPTSEDTIRATLRDIYINRELILCPTYKQLLSDRSDKRKIHHLIVTVTKVYFFPYPRFSDTIYLYRDPLDGLVPVAYAINTYR